MRLNSLRATAALVLASCASDGLSGLKPKPVTDAIAAWGDSLTECCGDSYPSQLALLLSRAVFNGGMTGETSTQILARFLADTADQGDVQIFWMGRNNFADPAQVEADIAQAIAHMRRSDRRFVVMSVLNGNYPDELAGTSKYNEILALNGELAALYPNNFIDIRSVLAGTSDVPADSLRADELHLSTAGNRVVAEHLAAFIGTRGW